MIFPLRDFNFKGLKAIHVGACFAEEREWYDQKGFAKVLWIEGNHFLEKRLRRRLKPYPKQTYIIAVCSDRCEEVRFHITNNTQSSSILAIKRHRKYYPNVKYIKNFLTESVTLDSIVDEEFHFLSLDVQGAELLVLKGATALLPKIQYVYTEVNVEELYKGCVLLPEMDAFLADAGFTRTLTHIYPEQWGEAFYQRKN